MSGATDALLSETTSFLHNQIPITRAMGVRVEAYDDKGGRLVLTAPLEPNHNHLGTAFGGSLSALCTLAGYALLWLELGQRDSTTVEAEDGTKGKNKILDEAHIVVRDSAIQYKRPVRGEVIRVACQRSEAAVMAEFHERFAQKGKARVRLECFVEEEGQRCVEFAGTFVAIR